MDLLSLSMIIKYCNHNSVSRNSTLQVQQTHIVSVEQLIG